MSGSRTIMKLDALRGSVTVAILIAAAGTAHASVHRMFVTSAQGTGNLAAWPESLGIAGIAGGDQICQTLAANAGLDNPGAFRAWLSDSSTDAYCHVAGFDGTRADNCGQSTPVDAGPWQRADGKPFSAELQDLTSAGAVLYPGKVDEARNLSGAAGVFTGTDASGANTAENCADWTTGSSFVNGFSGVATSGTELWTHSGATTCDVLSHLYCFEVGSGDPLPKYAKPGAFVFVTSATGTGDLGSWPEAEGATGTDAGDAICQNLAEAAGLPSPGRYLAWLSTAGLDAVDRLPSGVPFRRPGGVEIAATKDGLLSPGSGNDALESDVEVDEQGNHAAGSVFTGTDTRGHFVPGHACNSWSSAAGQEVTAGMRSSSAGSWTDDDSILPWYCSSRFHLYCFSTRSTLLDDGFESGDRSIWAAAAPDP